MKLLQTSLTLITLGLLALPSFGLEPRTWIVSDGRVLEGELQTVSGNLVTILDKDGKKVQLDKSFLSIGDNEYIKENFPDAKSGGFSAAPVQTMPQPARTAKIDQRVFKMGAGSFALPTDNYDIMETPHFKVMYQKPVDPRDVGELAERMWIDAAFVHATFPQKFATGQKMAIFLAPDDSMYDRIGQWYAELISGAGREEDANRIKGTWPQSASANLYLTNEISSKYNVFDHARVFRAYRKAASANAKPELIKGVWNPFFVHCLATDMISLQAPGVTEFGSKGYFAVTGGHSYYKEVFLTGKSETGLLRVQSASGRDVSSVRGLEDARQWATELKKWVRKGEVKANFETLNSLTQQGTDMKGTVLAYGWARYLQSSIPKLGNFGTLIARIGTSRQVPEPDDFARIYGFKSGAEMEADFQKWLVSTEFR